MAERGVLKGLTGDESIEGGDKLGEWISLDLHPEQLIFLSTARILHRTEPLSSRVFGRDPMLREEDPK